MECKMSPKSLKTLLLSLLFSTPCLADDWGGKSAPIEKMYVYLDRVIVVQGDVYAGKAGCKNNNKWGFYWSDFSEENGKRIYSMLLAARMSQVPVQPLFHDTACSTESAKRFNGKIVI